MTAETSSKKKRSARKRRRSRVPNGGVLKYVGIVVAIVVVVILTNLGGGVSHGSPQKVVTSLWSAYGEGNEKQVLDCYGTKSKNADEELLQQVDATMRYIEAHGASSIDVKECDVLSTNGDVSYVYVIYDLILGEDSAYPCMSTHMVRKKGKNYYILPYSEITESMQERATRDFKKFSSTDNYRNFMMDYNTFIKKNPGYEEKISGILGV